MAAPARAPQGGQATCPLCAAHARPTLPGLQRLARSPYRRCQACGFLWAATDPETERRFYAQVYPHLPHKASEPQRRMPVFAAGLTELRRRSAGSRLLDVGCGAGHFLALARDQGWQCSGVELSPALATEARERSGCAVAVGSVEAVPAEPGFDVVTLWNVLDQVPDPRALLAGCRDRLVPGGLLFARVPSGGFHRPLMQAVALLSGTATGRALAGVTPLHPFLFRASDLVHVLTTSGFVAIEVGVSPPTRGDASLPLAAAKRAAGALAVTIEGLSGGRILLGSSLAAYARTGSRS